MGCLHYGNRWYRYATRIRGKFWKLIILFQIFEPNADYRESVFELVSAFATCGWSIGETNQYSTGGQLILSIAMFTGRFGPITLVLFMSKESKEDIISYPEERVRVG